jgi:opacity protein-like surface antigen
MLAEPQIHTTMKKLILPLLVAGAFAAPSMAQAASTPYVSLSSGLSLLNNSKLTIGGATVNDFIEYKTGYLVNGAVGLKMDDVRVEAEVGYHHNSVDKIIGLPVTGVNVSAWSFMANAYYDFDMKNSSITPFVMGGLGLADIKSHVDGYTDDSSTQFTWQLGAGIGIKASKTVTIDLGYRYVKPSSPDVTILGYNGKVSIGGSELLAGVRVDL